MSKEVFSQSIYNTIYKRIKLLEHKDANYFFQYDEIFELVLCLAYMTLSKESIIDKEIKSQDRLGRLTKMVATTDIDAVFAPSFNPEMPIVTNALENDNLWILDNFRDSIMHAAFDIDMENKCIVINNTQPERTLQATIPFSWLVAYTKNDIFRKKVLDKYTVRGFFYNDFKRKHTNLNPQSEISSHILYEVVVTGDKFKVHQVEDRIKELFELYKTEKIDQETFDEYQTKLPRRRNQYNINYLTRFAVISDKVKAKLKEEFPDLEFKIFIKDKKRKLSRQLCRKMDQNYPGYEALIDSLNNLIAPSSKTELNYIANIIQNLSPLSDEELKRISEPKAMFLFNRLIEDKDITYTSYNDVRKRYQYNLEQARIICLTAFAISTLVINQDSIYNSFYDGQNTQQYRIKARTKKPLEENLDKERQYEIELLKTEITLAEKRDQLTKCKSASGQKALNGSISKLEKTKKDLDEKLEKIWNERNAHKEYTRIASVERTKRELEIVTVRLRERIDSFYKTSDIQAKKRILATIKLIYKDYIEAECKDAYWIEEDMKVALNVIRNCFSHLERIYLGPDRKMNTTIILSDYDTKGKKSGEVITTYADLIYMLSLPLEHGPVLKKTL